MHRPGTGPGINEPTEEPTMNYSTLDLHTLTVSLYGFEMEVDVEVDAGEPPRFDSYDGGDPGWPAEAILLACRVGGVNVYDMLDNDQLSRIEEAVLRALDL